MSERNVLIIACSFGSSISELLSPVSCSDSSLEDGKFASYCWSCHHLITNCLSNTIVFWVNDAEDFRVRLINCFKFKIAKIVYCGHGTEDGDLFLPSKEIVTKAEIMELYLKNPSPGSIFVSLTCHTHHWTNLQSELIFVGSSTNDEPWTEIGLLIQTIFNTRQSKEKFLETFYYKEIAAVPTKIGNWDCESIDDMFRRKLDEFRQGFDINLLQRNLISNDEVVAQQTLKVAFNRDGNHFYPLGFADFAQFQRVFEGIKQLLCCYVSTVNVYFHGSCVSGYRYCRKKAKGIWFDSDSNFNICIVSSKVCQWLRSSPTPLFSYRSSGLCSIAMTSTTSTYFPSSVQLLYSECQSIFKQEIMTRQLSVRFYDNDSLVMSGYGPVLGINPATGNCEVINALEEQSQYIRSQLCAADASENL